MRKRRERLAIWLSWHLPAWVVYWCFVRVAVANEDGNPGDRTCGDAGKAWLDANPTS